MGKIISVWSCSWRTGKTIFLYMLANQLSRVLDKDLKILLCCINLGSGNLLSLYGINKDELNLEDLVNFKMHPGNKSFDLVNAIAKHNNNYFIGSYKTNASYAGKYIDIYENLLEELRQSFDIILIDTIPGIENPLTNMAMEMSDFVLNVIVQDKEILDRNTFITNKEIAFIINMYKDLYPDSKELSNIYGLKNLFPLPYCKDLQEMKNRGQLELYIQHDTAYNKAIKGITAYLIDELDLPLDKAVPAVTGSKRKNIFRKILEGAK